MVHSFLLIGQSNAAGRGFFAEAAPLDDCGGRLKVQRNGLWMGMFRPVNPDRPFSGTCLAESFARAYAGAHPNTEVGIIPCADGGTKISQWMPGEILFDNAVNCAKLAMRTSVLKGILWHQGESDCADELYPLYRDRFFTVMNAMREELGCPDIPILIGGLGDYLAKYFHSPEISQNFSKINGILEALGSEYPNCAFVPAAGLEANPDNLHFSAKALEEFGIRYYKAYEPFDRAEEDCSEIAATERSAIELL